MVDRIHPSILTTTCWYATKLRYVDGIRSRAGTAALIGTATHESHRRDLRYKLATGDLFTDSELADSAADTFEHEWAKGEVMLDDDEKSLSAQAIHGQTKDTAMDLARAAHWKLAPVVEVDRMEDLERRVDLQVSGAPWALSGYVDVFERSQASIRDTKTRGAKPSASDVQGNIQLEFYAFALTRYGESVDTIGLDVITRTKTPKVYRLTTPAPTDWSPLLARIEIASRIFEAGAFMPVDPTSQIGKWRCTPKFCGHYDACPFGRARKVSVAITNL